MQHSFNISFRGKEILVEPQDDMISEGTKFMVHLPEGIVEVQYQQDSDGANWWMISGENHSTELSEEIGGAIDQFLITHHD